MGYYERTLTSLITFGKPSYSRARSNLVGEVAPGVSRSYQTGWPVMDSPRATCQEVEGVKRSTAAASSFRCSSGGLGTSTSTLPWSRAIRQVLLCAVSATARAIFSTFLAGTPTSRCLARWVRRSVTVIVTPVGLGRGGELCAIFPLTQSWSTALEALSAKASLNPAIETLPATSRWRSGEPSNMATVWIPPLLRDLTGGQEQVTVPGEKVRDLIAALDTRYPGLQARLVEDGTLRRGIVLTVDGVANRQGLRARVQPDSEVHFIPAIGGG